MDEFENSRRRFLRKLGLTLGASMVVATAEIRATILDKKDELAITPDQQKFMDRYEKWMDKFIEVIRKQKADPDDINNNREIVRLSEVSKGWQQQLSTYMKDENFARYYMASTERMTKEI